MLDFLVPISLFIMAIVVILIGIFFIYDQYISISTQKKTQELECKYREQQIENETKVLIELNDIKYQLKRVLNELRIKE